MGGDNPAAFAEGLAPRALARSTRRWRSEAETGTRTKSDNARQAKSVGYAERWLNLPLLPAAVVPSAHGHGA
jgi:hypothetical protein